MVKRFDAFHSLRINMLNINADTPVSQRANAGSNHRAPKSYGKESVGLIYWRGRTARTDCGVRKRKHSLASVVQC